MRKLWSLALLALLAVVPAGCGGSKQATPPPEAGKTPPATAPAAPAKPAEPQRPPTVEVTVAGTDREALKHLPLLMPDFGEQEGIKVSFKEYKGGSEVAKALLNGEADFAYMSVEHVLKDKSGEFRALALITRGPGQALVVDSQYKDTIKSVKDLEGKKVGVSSLGSGPHQLLLTLLAKNGVDPKTVTVLPTGLDTMSVLGTDKVAAMVTLEPHITKAVNSGKGVVLVDARKPEGVQAVYGVTEMPWIALTARTAFISEKADVVQRMVNATVRQLGALAAAPPNEVSKRTPDLFKAAVGGDEALFVSILAANKATFSPDGRISREGLEAMWQSLQAAGTVPRDKSLAFESAVETRFLDKAVASK